MFKQNTGGLLLSIKRGKLPNGSEREVVWHDALRLNKGEMTMFLCSLNHIVTMTRQICRGSAPQGQIIFAQPLFTFPILRYFPIGPRAPSSILNSYASWLRVAGVVPLRSLAWKVQHTVPPPMISPHRGPLLLYSSPPLSSPSMTEHHCMLIKPYGMKITTR